MRDFGRLDLIGVYTHEGQLAGLTGPRDELRAAGRPAGQRLADVAAELRTAGFNVERVSVGSTPGWDSAPFVRGIALGLPLTAARQLEPGLEFGVAYEEHGLLSGPVAATLAVGQRMQILPNHACGVTNMWSRVYVADGEEVVADWAQVARH